MKKAVRFLYQVARKANDIETFTSFDGSRIAKRMKNKYMGRKLVRKMWKWPF